MKTIHAIAACLYLLTGSALAQVADAPAGAPQTAASIASPQPVASGAVAATLAADQALRQDIALILATTTRIAQTQEDEGSLLLKVRDGFVTNTLWEIFGFKSTEKTLVGYAISLLGLLGLGLKAVWYVSKSGAQEPPWARALTSLYLLVVVSVFTLLAFSGGVVAEVPASHAAARPLLEASDRLEAAADRLLRAQVQHSAIGAAAPAASAPASSQGAVDIDALATLRLEVRAIAASSDTAARMSAEAARRSTGWGWHVLIVLLLGAVLLLQVVGFDRTRP